MALPTKADYENEIHYQDLARVLRNRGMHISTDFGQDDVIAVAMDWDRRHPDEAVATYEAALAEAEPWKTARLREGQDNRGTGVKAPRKRPVGWPTSAGVTRNEDEETPERNDYSGAGGYRDAQQAS
jgi:hypothetical protein